MCVYCWERVISLLYTKVGKLLSYHLYVFVFLLYFYKISLVYSFFTVFSLQSILFISVSAIPLPGSVGSSESAFLTLFKTLFPSNMLNSAMLLSRGISFYLFVIVSGLIVLFINISKNKYYSKHIFKRLCDKNIMIER